MSKVIKLKKGLNIPLKGKAEKVLVKPELATLFAVKPADFHGIRPKMIVKPDDEVKAGTPLFFDKYNPDVLFTSPVSGRIVAVNRGERRRILEVVIKSDGQFSYEEFGKADPGSLTRDEIVSRLLKTGLWPFIRQRPYGVIPKPEEKPRSIFISGFDSAPLAPDYDFIMQDAAAEFQAGIDVLRKLTDGRIHLNLNNDYPPSDAYLNARGRRSTIFPGRILQGTRVSRSIILIRSTKTERSGISIPRTCLLSDGFL
jgi:Na+-transporting NADH:ubiquinone oxidoreductase subunit A